MSAIDPAELARDAASEIPDDHALADVAELAEKQLALERQIEAAEARVEELRAELQTLSGKLLPDAMEALGLTELKLRSGEKLQVRPILRANIPEAHRAEALAWLRENGFADLVKHSVTADFGRGREAEAIEARRKLEELGAVVADRESVHPSTLSAFVREQDEAGVSLPEQILGVYRGAVTKIVRPRSK